MSHASPALLVSALAAALVASSPGSVAAATSTSPDPAHTGRLWLYASGTAQLSPSWSLTLIPGLRYELARSGEGATTKGHYLDEVFFGPNWSTRIGPLGVKVSLWYYFLGFPRSDTYPLSHNLELIPSVEYRTGAFSLSYRAIFHNTLYASVYSTDQRWGLGTVMRNLLMAKYAITESVTALLGDEPWFGIVEQQGVAYNGAGYWQSGFRLNRIYAGVDWKLDGGLSLSPQYVFETAFDADAKVTEMGHYLFVTLGYAFKAY